MTPGEYTVKASLYGYGTATATVTVADKATVTQDFALAAKAVWKVSGTVSRDSAGKAVAGATVSLSDTPVQPVVSDADGHYTLPEVAAGTYTLQIATPQGCLGSASIELTVDGDESQDVALGSKRDKFGYSCGVETAKYIEADEQLALSGDEATAKIDLPFAFPLYNEVYRSGWLASDGYLGFQPHLVWPFNKPLPDKTDPNAAIYPFWDDVRLDSTSKVYTKTLGKAPNRRFVIEFRDATMFSASSARVDFEMVLHETSGDILFAYRNLNPEDPNELGYSATVGIENATGTDALQYSHLGSEPLSDERAIRITPPDGGYLNGTVTDENDGDPVGRATVTASAGGEGIATTTTDSEGRFAFRVPPGTGYDVSVDASGYSTQHVTAQVKTDEWSDIGIALPTGALKAEVDGDLDPWVVQKGGKAIVPVTVTNTGSKPLTFSAGELGGAARTTAAREPGEVISEFRAPGLKNISGTAVDGEGNIWLNDFPSKTHVEYDRKKLEPTGRENSAWYSSDDVDFTYDTQHGLLCQPTKIGPASLIACIDPETGTTRHLDVSPVGGGVSRALGYRADDDTFYLGSADTGKIYQVAGLSHEKPGKLIAGCQWTKAVYGVAYHPGTRGLYLVGDGDIFTYDMGTCKQTGTIPDPEAQKIAVSGIDTDPSGDLWISTPGTSTVYRVSSGHTAPSDVTWLSTKAPDTTLEPGESATVTVAADTAGLKSGTYKAYVELTAGSGRAGPVTLPVRLVVSAHQQAVDAGAREAYTDGSGSKWSADRVYRAGSFGWTGRSRIVSVGAAAAIAGTKDDKLYRTQREGMDTYRFDNLPAGTYQVTLAFAEPRKRTAPGSRVFDVTANGKTVLSGYDIAEAVGTLAADRQTFLLTVGEGGHVTVGFSGRRGSLPPVVGGISVAHRPDLG